MGPKSDPKYEAAWSQVRRADRWVMASVLVLVGGCVVAAVIDVLPMIVVLVVVFGLMIDRGSVPDLRCPRCGECFWGSGDQADAFTDAFARSCEHCGLAFGAPRDPDRERARE